MDDDDDLATILSSLPPLGTAKKSKAPTTANPYDPLIEESARRNNVDPDFIRAVMGTESENKPKAKSWKGASGLMQLIPSTASRFGVNDIYDPKQNIEGGTKYLRFLLDRYDGDVERALVGYNAGEGKADRKDWKEAAERWSNSPTGRGATSADYYRKIRSNYGGVGYHPAVGTMPGLGSNLIGLEDLVSGLDGGTPSSPTGLEDLVSGLDGGTPSDPSNPYPNYSGYTGDEQNAGPFVTNDQGKRFLSPNDIPQSGGLGRSAYLPLDQQKELISKIPQEVWQAPNVVDNSKSIPYPEDPYAVSEQAKSALRPDSPRLGVLVTKGEETPQEVIANRSSLISIEVEQGTLFVNKEKVRQRGFTNYSDLEQFVKTNGFTEFIGKVDPVKDTRAGLAVLTTDKEGRELSWSQITSPEKAEEQMKVDRDHFGDLVGSQDIVTLDVLPLVRKSAAGDDPPSATDDPELRKAALLKERKDRSDELARAKTKARREILLRQLKKIDEDLLRLDQEVRAMEARKGSISKQPPPTTDMPSADSQSGAPPAPVTEEPTPVRIEDYEEYVKFAEADGQTPMALEEFIVEASRPGSSTSVTGVSTKAPQQQPGRFQQAVTRPVVKAPVIKNQQPTNQPAGEPQSRTAPAPVEAKTNEDVLAKGNGGTVDVDMRQKPKGMNAGRYMLGEALKVLAPEYGYTPEDVEKLLDRQGGKYTRLYNDITDEDIATALNNGHPGIIKTSVSLAKINELLKLKRGTINDNTFEPEIDERVRMMNAQTDRSPIVSGKDYGSASIKDELMQKAVDNVTYSMPSLFGASYDEEVQAEYERLQRTELSNAEAEKAKSLGEFIKDATGKGYIPESVPGMASGLIESVAGRGSELLAGIYKYSLPGLLDKGVAAVTGKDPHNADAITKFGNKAKVVGMSAKGDGIVYDIGNFIGNTGGDAARLIGVTALSGGNPIIAFGVDDAFRSAGRGESVQEQIKAGGKGALFGAIFSGASRLGTAVEEGLVGAILPKGSVLPGLTKGFRPKEDVELAAKLAGELTRVGSIGAGGFLVAKAEGESNEAALKHTALMLLVDLGFHHNKYGKIADLSGKVFRLWKNGEYRDFLLWLKDSTKRHADVYDVTGKVPDKAVQATISDEEIAGARNITPKKPEKLKAAPSDIEGTKAAEPPTKPLTPQDPVKKGQSVEVKGKGEGVVVEDRGKNVVVDTNPKVDKNGETVYQSRAVVRKDEITAKTPEEPIGDSPYAIELAALRNIARKEGDLVEEEFDAAIDQWESPISGKTYPIVETGDVIKYEGQDVEVTAGNNPYTFPSEEIADKQVQKFQGKKAGSDAIETLDATKIETAKNGAPKKVGTNETVKPSFIPTLTPEEKGEVAPAAKTETSAKPIKVQGIRLEKREKTEVESSDEGTVHKFSSTQANLPKEHAAKVLTVGEKLIPETELYTDPNDPSYGREKEPHVTVKYGLHTDKADDVRSILAQEKPFTAKLGKVSIFAGKDDTPYDVVKADVESSELHRLNKLIAENTKVTDTHPGYVPHVTLAYVKKGEGEKYVGNTELEGTEFPINSIAFSSKNGEMVDIPLGGSSNEVEKDAQVEPDGFVEGRPAKILDESPGNYKIQFLDGKRETPIVKRAAFTSKAKAEGTDPKQAVAIPKDAPDGAEYEDLKTGDVWTVESRYEDEHRGSKGNPATVLVLRNKEQGSRHALADKVENAWQFRPVEKMVDRRPYDKADVEKLVLPNAKNPMDLARIDVVKTRDGRWIAAHHVFTGSAGIGEPLTTHDDFATREEAIRSRAAQIVEWGQRHYQRGGYDAPKKEQKALHQIIAWAKDQWLAAGGKATNVPGTATVNTTSALIEFQADDKAFDLMTKLRRGEGDEAAETELKKIADEFGVSEKDFQEVLKRVQSDRQKRERERRASDIVREYREPKGAVAEGSETVIEIPDSNTTYKARYTVREIDDIFPSHNPVTFQPNPDYFFVNDRHYDKEEQYQIQVIDRSKAENFKPNLVINDSPTVETGTPVIDAEGNVLGGNSRAMIISRVYDVHESASKYLEALQLKAAQFGIKGDIVNKFRKPVLVRELLDEDIEAQSAITDLNKTSTTDLTTTEKAVAEATKLSDDAVEYITNKIEVTGDEASLPETLNQHGVEIINHLIEDGVFGAGERNVLLDDEKITEDGKRRIERLLLGKVFTDLDQLELVTASTRNVLTRVISPLMKVNRDPEWNILGPLREAIDLINDAKAVGQGKRLDEFANHTNFLRPQGWTPQALGIAKVINSGLKTATATIKQYAEDMRLSKYNEGAMFDLGAKTQADAFADAFGVLPASVTDSRISNQEQVTDESETDASSNAIAATDPKDGIAPETSPESTVQNNAVAPDTKKAVSTSDAFDAAFEDLFGKEKRETQADEGLAKIANEIASIMEFDPDTLKSVIPAVTKEIRALLTSPKGEHSKVVLAPVTANEVKTVKDRAGVEIDTRYRHILDKSAVNHVLKSHGNEKTETARGQIAVTAEDFERIPGIIAAPDKVENAGKNSIGLDLIRYTKRFNGEIFYVEEVRTGNKELAFQTMYKRKSGGGQMASPSTLTSGTTPDETNISQNEPGTLKKVVGARDISEIFYSQVEKTIEAKMPNKAFAAQVRGLLKPEYGVKQEERDWLGIDDFLKQKSEFTKQEVLDYVRANNVKVEEVAKDAVSGTSKYSQYTLAGGENYRELLLTMPESPNAEKYTGYILPANESQADDIMDQLGNMNISETAYERVTDSKGFETIEFTELGTQGFRDVQDIAEFVGARVKTTEVSGNVKSYSSPHFDEPNILAHIRFDEREDGKTLHIAEIQSDWHQEGRERGYRLTELERVALEKKEEELQKQVSVTNRAVARELVEVRQRLEEGQYGTPPAPFKKTWHELAMKRMIRYAAEKGYKRITWDVGETHAERYSLAQAVSEIRYSTNKEGLKSVEIDYKTDNLTERVTLDKDGVMQGSFLPEFEGKRLDQAVGKEIAKDILDNATGKITGDGLKVGGRGMIGFYDRMLPQFIDKYTKKWGGHVEPATLESRGTAPGTALKDIVDTGGRYQVELSNGERWGSFETPEQAKAEYSQEFKPDGVVVHSLTITPEMRVSVMSEGQRLYKVITDEMSEEDRMTYEQMQELPFASFDELLLNARSNRVGNLIKANAQSHEIYRRTFEEARIREGRAQLGGKDAEDLFGGVFLKPEAVRSVTEILYEKAFEAKGLGFTDAEIAVFESHAKMLEEAAVEGKGTAIVYVFDQALPEELFHNADYVGASDKSILNRHADEYKPILDTHPVVQKLWTKHFSQYNEYTRIKNNDVLKAVLRAEIPPYLLELSDDEIKALGLTRAIVDDYLMGWFRGYAEKNGPESLNYFKKDEIDVDTYIERITQTFTRQDGPTSKVGEADTGGRNADRRGKTEEVQRSRGPSSKFPKKPERQVNAGDFGDEAAEYFELAKNEKFASLPKTLRRAGLDADDIVYQVFNDKAAIASAEAMLNENGIPGSIKLLRDTKADALDVDHAILSFMLQRSLMDHAVSISKRNPEAAAEARAIALKLGREHSMKAIGAGRFTRAASIVGHSLEHLMYTAQGVVTDKYGEDKTLSAEEWERIEARGREAEEAIAQIAEVEKERRRLEQKIKVLEAERDGTRNRRRSPAALKARKQLVDLIKAKQSSKVDAIKKRLIAQLGDTATLKSVLGEPMTLKAVLDSGEFDDALLNDLAEVGAMMLTEGLASADEYLPSDFHTEMMETFGDAVGPNFQEIYMRSWNRRNEWLNEIRSEQTKERVLNKYGEDLDDWEIEEIVGENKAATKRRRTIESMHRMLSQGKKPKRNAADYRRLISAIAETDEVALAGILISENLSVGEIYRQLEELGVTDEPAQREALRKGKDAFEKAKIELRIENDAIANELLEQATSMRQIDDLRWKARQNSVQAEKAVAAELRRIKTGEFWYRTGQVADIMNAMRTMMASLDMSGALRQGGFFSFGKPEQQRQAFVNMFKAVQEKGYGRAIQAIENHPNFVLAQRSGVSFAIAGKREDEMGEELFRGEETIESLPLIGKWLAEALVKPSERTYTAFLDTQRMVMFDVFAKELMSAGFEYRRNKPEFEKIADFVSIATGRGKMPSARIAKVIMDLPLFAPRYTLSRFQLLNITLNPVAYYNLPPGARKVIAQSAVRFYATIAAIIGTAAALGLTSLDDDDEDFLKIKVGNSRYDVFAGTLQPLKLIIKSIHAIVRGNRIPGERSNDIGSALLRFGRGKLSPGASLLTDWVTGSDYIGNEFSWGRGVGSRLVPLTITDTIQAYQLDGAIGIARTLPAAWFGVGVSTYPQRPERPRTEAEKLATKAMSMRLQTRPQSAEDKEARTFIQKLQARARAGDDVTSEVTAALVQGKISEEQKKDILAAKTKSYLQQKAEGLSLPDFEAVYAVATDAEKVQLQSMLEKKRRNAAKKDGGNDEEDAPVKVYKSSDSFLQALSNYADAISTDPVDAFDKIFKGETIEYTTNGTIVVRRPDEKVTNAIKKDRRAGKLMRLDHTIPLQLGGDNSLENLKLVPMQDHAAYTPVENALGEALRSGRIKGDEARKLILDFKNGLIGTQQISDRLGMPESKLKAKGTR